MVSFNCFRPLRRTRGDFCLLHVFNQTKKPSVWMVRRRGGTLRHLFFRPLMRCPKKSRCSRLHGSETVCFRPLRRTRGDFFLLHVFNQTKKPSVWMARRRGGTLRHLFFRPLMRCPKKSRCLRLHGSETVCFRPLRRTREISAYSMFSTKQKSHPYGWLFCLAEKRRFELLRRFPDLHP